MSPEVSISSRKSRNIGRDLDGSCNEVKKKKVNCKLCKIETEKEQGVAWLWSEEIRSACWFISNEFS